MNSFGEIRTCLVLAFSAMLIIKTRARFIYHSDPILHCMQAKVPCSGHPSESSCNEYCIANGFPYGSCSSSCCLCHTGVQAQGHPMQQSHFAPTLERLEPEQSLLSKILAIEAEAIGRTEKPKRHINHLEIINNNEINDDEMKSSVCLSPECVKSANALLVNMDESVSPCDDFYQFACGNFEASTVVPDDKSEVTLIGSLTDKLHQQIRVILEDKEIAKDKKSAQLAKNLYASCSDRVSLDSNGMKPLLSLLESQGGWPVLEGESWASSSPLNENWSWTEATLRLQEVGISAGYFLGIGVGPDIKNPGRRIINIREPTLGLSKEQLPNLNFIRDYQKYQVDVAVLLGAQRDTAIQEMGEVLEFEKALAHIALPREAARGHPLMFYNPMNIEELQKRFPGINWLDFIQRSLPESIEVGPAEVVTVAVPHQLTNLLSLMKNTDKRILANYLLWRTASSVLSYLSDSVRDVQFQFTSKVTGQPEKPPKWRECVGLVTSTLAHAVGSLYVKQYFKEDARTEAVKMFQDIHDSFTSLLTEADWMDPDSKQKAFEKAKAMRSHIAYPEELLQEENLLGIYNGLELSKNNFLGNILNITKSATNFALSKLRKPLNRNDWIPNGKPAVINAFYNPLHNSIQFPAGILQGQFFNSGRSHVLNYGAIGWVYGHELIHGFDDQGSHFDLNGDVKDWWDPQTKQKYHEKTKCIVNQYGQFSFSDLVTNHTAIPLNGVISQGENIADNGGIKLAYRGYQLWVKRSGQEKRLPGLQQYTTNQLFWLSAANNWCSKHRPEALVHSFATRVHPPGNFRVLGSFRNSKQFSKDFNCPAGSKMNPVDKCTVW